MWRSVSQPMFWWFKVPRELPSFGVYILTPIDKKQNFFNKMWFIWQPITNTTNKSTQKGNKYLFLQSESKLGRRNQISASSFWFFKPTVAAGVGMTLLPLPLCEGLGKDNSDWLIDTRLSRWFQLIIAQPHFNFSFWSINAIRMLVTNP